MEGNVIIVDDDRSLRMILAQALSRAGCKVRATGTLSTLWRWLEDGDGEVDKYEYLSHMVVMLGKLHKQEVDEIMTRFKELDVTGDGKLSRRDFEVESRSSVKHDGSS